MARSAIIEFLKKKEGGIYAAKLVELRDSIDDWLSYTTQTFPHYTRHTVKHSEEIILQLSNILFIENKHSKPVFGINPVEAYILCAAAYLHDAGMVCADEEKKEILGSDAWKGWLERNDYAREAVNKVEQIRSGKHGPDSQLRHFAADLELRRLIADFVRRSHHERSSQLVTLQQSALGRCGFDDPSLTDAIAAVCRGHGLTHEQLDNENDFPTSTQIRGENVNLRMLAILFRLGDLLDVSHQRACTLILNAANPIPPDSKGHWEQYAAIKQKFFSPDELKIVARCDNPDQHRILTDWFKWIVDEVTAAPRLLARSQLHKEWRPPHAQMGGQSPTIIVEPSPSAIYRPVNWTFEISPEHVIERFTRDAYRSTYSFIRELIQNSLDAIRCRMYATEASNKLSANPALAPDDIRSKFQIRLKIEKVTNRESLEEPAFLRLTIDDEGMGMNEEIITQHLLQIGRSYYQTENFRRRYSFAPNSAFGVGFLSVFNVSDRISIDTRHHDLGRTECGLSLTLTAPRGYIAVEKSTRDVPGTKITLDLRQDIQLSPGDLTEITRRYCRAVEFPVLIEDFDRKSKILAGDNEPSLFSLPDVERAGYRYELRRHSRSSDAGQVNIYLLVHLSADGHEDWSKQGYYSVKYSEKNPHAEYIQLPENITTLGGISVGDIPTSYAEIEFHGIERIDVRDRSFKTTMSREAVKSGVANAPISTLRMELWQDTLRSHLQNGKKPPHLEYWKYIQRLANAYPIDNDFWLDCENGMSWLESGSPKMGSTRQLLDSAVVDVIAHDAEFEIYPYPQPDWKKLTRSALRSKWLKSLSNKGVFLNDQLKEWSLRSRKEFGARFIPKNIRRIGASWRVVTFVRRDEAPSSILNLGEGRYYEDRTWSVCEFDSRERLAILPLGADMSDYLLVAQGTPLHHFLLNLSKQPDSFSEKRSSIVELIRDSTIYSYKFKELIQYIEHWNKIPNLPESLKVKDAQAFVSTLGDHSF